MKFFRFKSKKQESVPIKKYLIDWDDKNCSKPEWVVKQFLKPYWKNHVVCAEFRIPGSLNRLDYLNLTLNIAVEVSPESTHGEYNEFMHGSRSGYIKRIKVDLEKEEWCNQNKIKMITLEDIDFAPENLNKKIIEEKFEVTL